jgi:PKD repeat protein
MRKGMTWLSAVFVALAAGAACTVQQSQTPSLAGPSGFAQSIRVTATPDSITQDGASQSAIAVTVQDADGRPASGVPLRLDMAVGGVIQDFGTLSARNVVTGSDGKANAVFTSPPAPPAGLGGSGTVVTILAIASGSDAYASLNNGALADILLIPPGVILPPAGTPLPDFIFSPGAPTQNTAVFFDASPSLPGSGATAITSYVWDFGDGGRGTGRTVSHSFDSPNTYQVTLTVTNDRGLSASTTKTVTVAGGQAPTASFVFSPGSPLVNQAIQFNASASNPGPGRVIVSYVWNWGDGTPNGAGQTTTHTYTVAGSYNVTLTVTDDAGLRGTATNSVTVGTGNPTASFTFTTAAGHVVNVDASASQAFGGATIVTYAWTWGDTLSSSVATPTTSHDYDSSGTIGSFPATVQIRLTVTDSVGRSTTSAPQSVTIPGP